MNFLDGLGVAHGTIDYSLVAIQITILTYSLFTITIPI